MKKRILYIFIVSLSIVGCKVIERLPKLIITNQATVYSTVIQFDFENGKKSNKGKEIARYGYDQENNLIENYDKKGLFLQYKFDSINNVSEELFYENYDSISGIRTPSARWINIYDNKALKTFTVMFEFQNSNWVVEDTVSYEYSLNEKNQIIERKYYSDSKQLKWIEKSEYIQNAPTENQPYDFNRIGTLTKHYCSKETTYKSDGTLLDSTVYTYDNLHRLIKKIDYRNNQKYPTVIKYKYNESNQIIEQSQYFGDGGSLFYKKHFTYNSIGLRLTETWYDSSEKPKWIKEHKY